MDQRKGSTRAKRTPARPTGVQTGGPGSGRGSILKPRVQESIPSLGSGVAPEPAASDNGPDPIPIDVDMKKTLLSVLCLALLGAAPWNRKKAEEQAVVEAEAARALLPWSVTRTTDGYKAQAVDLDEDGEPEMTNYFDESRVLVRRDTDLNKDGQVDVFSFFDETGYLGREEMDGDFDGQVDWIDHYRSGQRYKAEIDTDYDTRFDVFIYYEGGQLHRRERDTDGDGRVDYWEDSDGTITRENQSGDRWALPAVPTLAGGGSP